MRTLTTLTMAAALALVLGAGQASALTSVNLKFLGGATGTAACTNGTNGVDCVHTNVSDIIKFAVVVDVGTEGIATFAFDLAWDQDGKDELDLNFLRARNVCCGLALLTDDVPPVTFAFNPLAPVDVTESTPGNAGTIIQMGYVPTGVAGFPGEVSFRMAIVKFHVNGNVNKDPGADIQLGFFDPDSNEWSDSTFNRFTPDFGSFAVDSVPEPGTSLLMGMGALGLILAGRASRKS